MMPGRSRVIASGAFTVSGSVGPIDVADYDDLTILMSGNDASNTMSLKTQLDDAGNECPCRSEDVSVLTAFGGAHGIEGVHTKIRVHATIVAATINWALCGTLR